MLGASPSYAESGLQSSVTDTVVPVYHWKNETPIPRGTVLMVHGLTQRACSLHRLANQLAASGFQVYGIDLRGHGWWHFCHHNGDVGYSCDFQQSVQDVDAVLLTLREQYPGLPLFMIGESIGASVVLRAAVDSPGTVNGLVLAGTGSKLCHVKFAWVASDLLRNHFRLHHQINIVRYQLKYGSDDPLVMEETLKDPLQRRSVTLGEMMQVSKFIGKNRKYARSLNSNVSALVIQGSEDHTLQPKSARKVFDAIPTDDKQMVVVPKCGHILLGIDHIKLLVSDSINTFLKERAPQQTLAVTGSLVPN
jgi:alpha-beta hydrolase superfamily lysophospholipase